LAPWAKLVIAPGSCVTSDGLLGFEVLERLGYIHQVTPGLAARMFAAEIGVVDIFLANV
jgi:hypothetical protein